MSGSQERRDESARIVGVAVLFAKAIRSAVAMLDMAEEDCAAELFDIAVENAATYRHGGDKKAYRVFYAAASRHAPGEPDFEEMERQARELNAAVFDYNSQED